ncbi:MAG: ABC transporter permease [Streptococcaceae bacterium]|jgi:simple sugar transport system permease protein|nr:ABC transporter permease [Streptococcaceae bacterium]
MTHFNLKKTLVPLIAVLFGFLLGAVIMLAFGYNPLWGYEDLLSAAFGSAKSIGEIFRSMGPLILTALSFAVASRAGLFNIGMSGQALAGWLAAVWFALTHPDLPRLLMIPAVILIGMLAGAIIAMIPGLLKAFFGTSEVIVTIMMNYVVLFISTHIVHNVWDKLKVGGKTIMQSKDSTTTVGSNATFRTDFLSQLTDNSRLNIGIFIAIIALLVFMMLFKWTTLGFEIRAVGLNPHASEYAGISAKRTVLTAMLISGALAGLGGVCEGLGTFQNFFVQTTSLPIGFDGMAVALLGQSSAIGIFFAAALFSVLKVGAPGMTVTGIPSEIVSVVIAAIIFFVGIKFVIDQVLPEFQFKKKDVNGGQV